MTSIMHPATFARLNATEAKELLTSASVALRNPQPMIGIPEHNGPDSPDNPWFAGRHHLPVQDSYEEAASLATAAVQKLDRAIGMERDLPSDAALALGRAREQALAGVRTLQSPITAPIDTSHVPLQFDAATLWIDLAVSLIDLTAYTPGIVPAPTPMPGEPGSPITIQPLSA